MLRYARDVVLSRLARWVLAPALEIWTSKASSVPCRWVLKPDILQGEQVCLFVTYAPNGKIPAHAIFHARAWAIAGFKVNLTVVLDDLESFVVCSEGFDFAAGILLRQNQGYDFGAWAGTICQLQPDLQNVSLLCIANDSVYGPLNTFPTMIELIKSTDADMIGLTESYENRRHFQSYILIFRRLAICHPSFIKFWQSVKTGKRWFVIERYELRLLVRMQAAGLRTIALYNVGARGVNPTLAAWRELLAAGFPFLKVQLLRDNPLRVDLTGWDTLVRERGYDLKLIREHLGVG